MKKMLLMAFGLVFIFPIIVDAKELKVEWQESSNVIVTGYDSINTYLSTKDGGTIAVGISYPDYVSGPLDESQKDALILKYDKDGNLLWKKNWGGRGNDIFYKIILTEDGGYAALGTTDSNDIEGFSQDFKEAEVIVKYDKDGNVLWQRAYGDNHEDNYSFTNSVIQTKDGGFAVVSFEEFYGTVDESYIPDALIIKYDKDGNEQWKKLYGNISEHQYFNFIIETEDNGFVAIGSEGRYVLMIKYDKDGNMLWQKNWGGSGYNVFNNVLLTEDGGIIAIGETNSTDIEGMTNKGLYDAIVVKYDKDGNILWQKNWGGDSSDSFTDIILTEEGDIVTIGSSYSTEVEGLTINGCMDAIIVKYDKDGNMLWQKNWGGNKGNTFRHEEETFNSFVITEDGGIIVVGNSKSEDIDGLTIRGYDAIMIKYDKDGNILWQKSWGGNHYDVFNDVFLTKDGGITVIGETQSTDIEGILNESGYTNVRVKYLMKYDIENLTVENGTSTVVQQGKYGIITPLADKGYEVDKIIVKDKEGDILDLEVTKLEDGTYSFELYDDVSVEVLFKEALVNPKTGLIDVLLILFVGLVISFSGFFIVKRYNERFEF